jgi:uncharacterized membrane protein YedE/YeeE
MRILTMLSQAALPSINVLEGGVILGLRMQYIGIMLGYACLGLVFTRMIEGRLTTAARAGDAPRPTMSAT